MLLIAATLVGCAASGPVEPAASEPAAVDGSADDRGAAEVRAVIDRAGRAADCSEWGREDRVAGSQAWLGAWCGLRAHDWQLAASAAAGARAHFEASGALRRQIEMGLIEAIAARQLRDPDARAHAARAFDLWKTSRMPLHGAARDSFAGDLPYLIARVTHEDLLADPTAPGGQTLRPRALLAIAWSEYRSFDRRAALAHVARQTVRSHLQAGRLGRALESMETAFELDRAAERTAGLRQDLELFARLCELLGLRETRRAIAATGNSPVVPTHPAADVATDELEAGEHVLKWLDALDRARLDGLLETSRGRRALADAIAQMRRSASSAIRPPPALVSALRAYTALDQWRGNSWRLGYQGGCLLAEHGHRHDARRYLQAAVDAIESMRASLATPLLRQRFFADKRPVYMALVDTYVGRDTRNRTQADYRRALQLANALKARGLIDLLDGRVDAPKSRKLPSAIEPVDLGAARSTQQAADRVLDHLERWGAPVRSGDRPFVEPVHLPASISSELDGDTAVLEYLITPRRSYVWVITNGGVEMRRLAGQEEIAPLIEEFLRVLVEPDSRPDASATRTRHTELAERLYVELIGPVEDLLDDVDRLMIAPDERLYELPFEALERPRPGDGQPRYLVAERTVSYVPSASVLARLLRRDAPADSKRALVLGAPDLDRPALELAAVTGEVARGSLYSLAEIFPDLPGTRAELTAVQKHLEGAQSEVKLLVGTDASETNLRAETLSDYGFIHLATHGVSDARPLRVADALTSDFTEPALLLSRGESEPDDGIVTLSEMLLRHTAARLVVLSGCTTGRGWKTLGDGAFGLAGAILSSGSHNVVASTWSVSDGATTELMEAVYEALAAGDLPAAALRKGQVAMIEQGKPPAHWAGFRLVGSGE